jgi:hypothetical protein
MLAKRQPRPDDRQPDLFIIADIARSAKHLAYWTASPQAERIDRKEPPGEVPADNGYQRCDALTAAGWFAGTE